MNVHLRNRGDSVIDSGEGLTSIGRLFDRCASTFLAVVHDNNRLFGPFLQCLYQALNFRSGLLGALGKGAYFIGNYGKATPLLTCTGGFNGRIEGQQISLLSDPLDHIQHRANIFTITFQCFDNLGRCFNLTGQVINCLNSALYYLVAVVDLFIGLLSGILGQLGIFGHLLHRGAHLIHSRRYLLGFTELLVGTRASLLSGGGELTGRAGKLVG